MKKEDLGKKLENIEIPEIEIQSHKRRLKMALMDSDYFQKSSFFKIFRKYLVFAVPALALLIILGITIIQPKLIKAKVLKLVENNPEIRKLIEEKNMFLGEVKIQGEKAYVLLNSPLSEPVKEKTFTVKIQEDQEDKIEEIEGAIIEVSLKQEKIAEINPIRGEDVFPLADEEKESAKEIVEAEEIIQEIIPKGAKIEKIHSSLPKKLRLIEKDHGVKVVPQPNSQKTVQIHYIFNGKKWVVKINLSEKRVEEIQYSPNKEHSKGRK